MRESKERITRVSSAEARLLKGETDYARLDAMSDDDIARAVADDPDAVPLDVDWTKARLVIPPGKDVVTLRLDRDVLDWFRAQGQGYQTRINQVLRAFYEARRNPLAADAVGVAADVAAAAKASGRGFNARSERAPRAAGLGVKLAVYIEARPKRRHEVTPIEDYVVEDHADHVLKVFKTQKEAIDWAKKQGHRPLVARVRENRREHDKTKPDHWRSA